MGKNLFSTNVLGNWQKQNIGKKGERDRQRGGGKERGREGSKKAK